MNGYQYILDLFQNILDNSKSIEGRFYIGHKYGLQDINYDNLGQTLNNIQAPKKYPLVMMAPPHSAVKFSSKDDGWDDYRITMFFMKQSFVEDIMITTKTSAKSIPSDWQDMKIAAVGFLKVLDNWMRVGFNLPFRYMSDHNAVIIPLSQIGADRISGVRVDFDLKIFVGCELEDYEGYPEAAYPSENIGGLLTEDGEELITEDNQPILI